MVLKLWSYLLGYVIIMVTGPGLEKFLNLTSQRRIPLWNIKRLREDVLIASLRVGGFRHLRPLLGKCGCRVKIKRKVGLPFFCAHLRRRWALCAGALLCLVAACLLAGQIWFIQLVGCPGHLERTVRRQLAAAGLVIGAQRSQLDPNQIAERIVARTEALAWAGVEFHGTLAKVQVVPKTMPKVPKRGPCHLTATRDAEIIHLIVYNGQGMVAPGEMVKKGQIIVSGQVSYGPDEANPLVRDTGREFVEPKVENIHASAFVEGRFWLEGYGEVHGQPVEKIQLQRKVLAREYYLGRVRLWQQNVAKKEPSMRVEGIEGILYKPLGIRVVTRWGIVEQEKKLDPEKVAYQLAQEQIRQQLGPKEKIQYLKHIVLREGELVRVKILAECKGPVAVEKPFQPKAEEGEEKFEQERGSEDRADPGAQPLRPPG